VLDADGDNITFKAGSGDTTGLDFSNSSGTWTVKAGTSDSDIIFNVNDGGVDTKVMTILGADAVVTFGGNSVKSGEIRILEDTSCGTNYTAFKVGTQSADLTYTLPTAYAACNGMALTATTAGVMSWAAAGGGSMTLINSQEACEDATLGITGLSSTYDTYLIAISDLVAQNDDSSLRLRLGDSSGIDSGGSDYAWHAQKLNEASTSYSALADTGSSHIRVADNIGNAAGEGVGAAIWLHRPGDGTTQPFVSGTQVRFGSSTELVGGNIIGHRQAVITLDRVEVSFGSGNIMSGRLTVWGLAHA